MLDRWYRAAEPYWGVVVEMGGGRTMLLEPWPGLLVLVVPEPVVPVLVEPELVPVVVVPVVGCAVGGCIELAGPVIPPPRRAEPSVAPETVGGGFRNCDIEQDAYETATTTSNPITA
jgi:hypothetical protein